VEGDFFPFYHTCTWYSIQVCHVFHHNFPSCHDKAKMLYDFTRVVCLISCFFPKKMHKKKKGKSHVPYTLSWNIVASWHTDRPTKLDAKLAVVDFLATLSRPRFLPIGNSYKLLQALPFLETAQLRGMLAKPPADGFERAIRDRVSTHHGSEMLFTAMRKHGKKAG